MRISDWSSDVCSSDLVPREAASGEESEDWVVSYMDMVTLLMIVFLTLVGMLWIDKKTRPTVVNVLQIETGQMPRRDFADAAPAISAVPQPAQAVRPLPENVSKIGRATCRERVCQYVYLSVFAVYLHRKKKK